MAKNKAAIGIIRVSRKGKREGDNFISPEDQTERMRQFCEGNGLALADTAEEISVSGGRPLEKRTGLLEAVEAIEAGRASVLIVGYFDRLVRSLKVQQEVVSRVEAAGGEVVAVDFGKVSEGTAAEWLSGTMMGAFAEYYRRSVGERTGEAKANAVARGVAPFVVKDYLGLERGADGVLAHTETAPLALAAYEMRADGATIQAIRDFLRDSGHPITYRKLQIMLSSKLYIGEIHFGELTNLQAHEPVVSRDLWNRVQRVKVSRGRRAKSDRLLARLGVLRCGTCGGRLVVGTSHGRGDGRYPLYRCSPTGDCPRRVTITAQIAEQVVSDAVKEALADVEGAASAEAGIRSREEALEAAQAKLDGALRAFADFGSEEAAQETLLRLRQDRDEAQEALDRVGGSPAASLSLSGADWDRLTLEERRDLIRATVDRAVVASGGSGADRITVHLL